MRNGVRVHRPLRGVLGVTVAMLLHESVEKLEELTRGAQIAERVFERVVADRFIDELAEPRPFAVGRCPVAEPMAARRRSPGEVVKRGAGPAAAA